MKEVILETHIIEFPPLELLLLAIKESCPRSILARNSTLHKYKQEILEAFVNDKRNFQKQGDMNMDYLSNMNITNLGVHGRISSIRIRIGDSKLVRKMLIFISAIVTFGARKSIIVYRWEVVCCLLSFLAIHSE